jgi:hypothetical protein
VTVGLHRSETGRGDPRFNLAGYCRPFRPAVQAFAEQSTRLIELSVSFPGLLFALATDFGSSQAREEARRLVEAGRPLREAARVMGLPWWLRRLPPEAFDRTLPSLPDDPKSAACISSIVAGPLSDPAGWLQRVGYAYDAAGHEFALWMARQRRIGAQATDSLIVPLLAAWAWHSMHAQGSSAVRHGLAWSDGIGQRAAVNEARAWAARLELAAAIGAGVSDSWLASGTVNGYEFVPLRTFDDFIGEAEFMRNCLDRFGDQVCLDGARVFSIRKDGRRVADIEIRAHDEDSSVPRIVQLRGPRNRRAAPEVWQAAYAWLAGQCYRPFPGEPAVGSHQQRVQLARALWRPYLDYVRGRRCERVVHRLVQAIVGTDIAESAVAKARDRPLPSARRRGAV